MRTIYGSRMNPAVVIYLVAFWLVAFLLAVFPARWVGNWLARKQLPMPFGIMACIKITILFVTFVSLFFISMRFDFPHSDDKGFIYFLASLLFGLPVFVALVLGFIRARKNECDTDSSDLISRRIRI
jgi:hypothetical protein